MSRPWPIRTGGRIAVLVVIVVAVLAFVIARGMHKTPSGLATTPVEQVERRDIAVTVEATGSVEPINLVEVKSKASGQIVKMPVEIGSHVKPGDLLVQVDPRDVQNSYDQAEATLVAAQARAKVTALQRKRADDLYAAQVITATEHESAMLDEANAESQLVTARTNLDIAKQRLDDATVRAPIEGTVLDKPVAVGQVISSATSSVSGGTTLLTMADLSRIRMRALVAETDIGRVQVGQDASVVVDAYPQRTFHGTVEKIEPQAVVQQSVTMFPVLISISNENGLLLPGMNGEVTMMVDQRQNALAVPLDALRSMREMPMIAAALDLNVDSLRAELRRDRPERAVAEASGERGVAEAAPAPAGADSARARRGRAAGGDSARAQRWRAAGGDSARARWRAARMRQFGQGGSAGVPGAGGGFPGGRTGGAGGFGAGGNGRGGGTRMQIAVVKTDKGYEPRLVRTGISDFDYAEVLSGLKQGDEVLMLGTLEIQAERNQLVNRVRERVGGGVTGTGGGRGGR